MGFWYLQALYSLYVCVCVFWFWFVALADAISDTYILYPKFIAPAPTTPLPQPTIQNPFVHRLIFTQKDANIAYASVCLCMCVVGVM